MFYRKISNIGKILDRYTAYEPYKYAKGAS